MSKTDKNVASLMNFYYEDANDKDNDEYYDDDEEDEDYYDPNYVEYDQPATLEVSTIKTTEDPSNTIVTDKSLLLKETAPKIPVVAKKLVFLRLDQMTCSLIFFYLDPSSLYKFVNTCKPIKAKLFKVAWKAMCIRDFRFVLQNEEHNDDLDLYDLYKRYFLGKRSNILNLNYAILEKKKTVQGIKLTKLITGAMWFKVTHTASTLIEVRSKATTTFVSHDLDKNALIVWELSAGFEITIKKEYVFENQRIETFKVLGDKHVFLQTTFSNEPMTKGCYIFDIYTPVDYTKDKRILYDILIKIKREHQIDSKGLTIKQAEAKLEIQTLNLTALYCENFTLKLVTLNDLGMLCLADPHTGVIMCFDMKSFSLKYSMRIKEKIRGIFLAPDRTELIVVDSKNLKVVNDARKITHEYFLATWRVTPSTLTSINFFHNNHTATKNLLFVNDTVEGFLLEFNLETKEINTLSVSAYIKSMKIVKDEMLEINVHKGPDRFILSIKPDTLSASTFDNLNSKHALGVTQARDSVVDEFDKDKLLIVESIEVTATPMTVTIYNAHTKQKVKKEIARTSAYLDYSFISCDTKKLLIVQGKTVETRSVFYIDIGNFFMLSDWTMLYPEFRACAFSKPIEPTAADKAKEKTKLMEEAEQEMKRKNKEFMKDIWNHNRQFGKKGSKKL
jgi:hypothetical protein